MAFFRHQSYLIVTWSYHIPFTSVCMGVQRGASSLIYVLVIYEIDRALHRERVNNCKQCTERYIGSVSTIARNVPSVTSGACQLQEMYRALHRERVNSCKKSTERFIGSVSMIASEDLSSVTSATCQRLYKWRERQNAIMQPRNPPHVLIKDEYLPGT